jgi:hypothetical protein
MTDTIDATPEHSKKESKYKRCSHCGMYSASEGTCPFCNKGVLR